MKIRYSFIIYIVLVAFAATASAQDLVLYSCTTFDKPSKESAGFVSLSDNYRTSEHPDSLAVPQNSTETYFKLGATYRKRFLSGTKISESDNVYIYDYETDVLLMLPVKQLAVVAFLSPYESGSEPPFRQDDFMIGFEIDKKLIKGFSQYSEALVYIGKDTPFNKGQVKAMMWKKITAKEFPAIADNAEMKEKLKTYGKHETAGYYKYEADGLQYFVHDITADMQTAVRRLVVVDAKTRKVVTEAIFYAHEGGSPAPLNGVSPDAGPYLNQYAGRLFKNKPPVVFGFEYVSFGCPRITFANASQQDVYINCDNRH